MDTSLISLQTVQFVSLLTGQKLRKEDVSPSILFLVSLITVLLGVIYVKGTASAEEMQQLVTTLKKLIPTNNNLRQLLGPIIKNVRDQQFYQKIQDFLVITECFSEKEKLLLISFGYQMSASDTATNNYKKRYLTLISNRLELDSRYLTVLEASFSNQAIRDTEALGETHSLLDPSQFQSLDSLFIRAASHIIEHLPAKPKHQKSQKLAVSLYQELKKFQDHRKQLYGVCYNLCLFLQDASDRNVIASTLTEEVTKEFCKLKSQGFRIAVVGEFSKGKSTLLNALLGEEIQPVRDIPCSGTVTILKYGKKQRVICKYKNGREEEISPQQYKDKASISEEAALGSVGDEIINSELQEIIFEHPNLELCRNGVEIIDSPGLNEHAERTLVTEQVLKTSDAVIFLTHAQNALTEKERELLLYLKKELNPGRDNEAAKNIFVLVNFADLLRQEESRKQVRKRVETIVNNQNLIAGENRIHFISAQSALDAILDGTENNYLKSFHDFIDSLEHFLTEERGAIALQQSATVIKQIIDTGYNKLSQYRKILEGKLTVSQEDKQKIFELIAEVSGRDVKIKLLAHKLMQQCLEETVKSWHEWVEGLGDRMIKKASNWTSEHSHIWSQNELIKDYANQFVEDITKEIDDWAKLRVNAILQPNMKVFESEIGENIYTIRQEFQKYDQQLSTSLLAQFSSLATVGGLGEIGIEGSGIASSISEVWSGGFGGGLKIGGAVLAGLFAFTGIGIIPLILASLAAGTVGGLSWSAFDGDTVKAKIKQKVCELGFQKFNESSQAIFEQIQERIIAIFDERFEPTSDLMEKAISLWENLLEQQERQEQQTQKQCETEKAWIAEQIRELEKIDSQLNFQVDFF